MKSFCISFFICLLSSLSLSEAGLAKGFSKKLFEKEHELPQIKNKWRHLAVGGDRTDDNNTGGSKGGKGKGGGGGGNGVVDVNNDDRDGTDGGATVVIPNAMDFYIVSQQISSMSQHDKFFFVSFFFSQW